MTKLGKREIVTLILDDDESDLAIAAEIQFGAHSFDTQFAHIPERDLVQWYEDHLTDMARDTLEGNPFEESAHE